MAGIEGKLAVGTIATPGIDQSIREQAKALGDQVRDEILTSMDSMGFRLGSVEAGANERGRNVQAQILAKYGVGEFDAVDVK